MRDRPSVADVARLAGVSVGTVSNVLNRPDRVSPATLERVQTAITDLGFVPSASARMLRRGVTQSIGAILLDLANPFFTALARGVEDRIAADSLALMLASSDEQAERERRALSLLEENGVRGILVTPARAEVGHLAAVRERGTPVVLVDAAPGGNFPAVSVDDVHGGRIAVAHLLQIGHRRIAMANGPHSVRQCADRWAGAEQAVREAGLDPAQVLTEIRVGSLNDAGGEQVAHTLLAQPASTRPTAVFCVNDLVALGLLRTALRAGLSVPGDLAVVGYDDVGFASMLLVPLTTVRQPTHRIGWAAADLLLRLGDAAEPPEHIHFTPELVVRTSTAGEASHEPAPQVSPAG